MNWETWLYFLECLHVPRYCIGLKALGLPSPMFMQCEMAFFFFFLKMPHKILNFCQSALSSASTKQNKSAQVTERIHVYAQKHCHRFECKLCTLLKKFLRVWWPSKKGDKTLKLPFIQLMGGEVGGGFPKMWSGIGQNKTWSFTMFPFFSEKDFFFFSQSHACKYGHFPLWQCNHSKSAHTDGSLFTHSCRVCIHLLSITSCPAKRKIKCKCIMQMFHRSL